MNDDLFTYEVRIHRLSYSPHGEQQCDDLGEYDDPDVINYKTVDKKIKEEEISKWLIRSYKMQFNEYMEIKKDWMTHGIDMEYNPSNVDFAEWIASKFSNHSTMDWYTKTTLWMYWIRGDDE
ncbi:hypothetical protein Tco_0753736 [Tanacetum coccineum]